MNPSGYQQGILVALGSWNGERLTVRHKDRWYADQIQPLVGCIVKDLYLDGRPTQYRVRSARLSIPSLDSITDTRAFARAYIEIHSSMVPITQHMGKRGKRHIVGLKIYGPAHVLDYLQSILPIVPKQLEHIRNTVGDCYFGETYCVTLQMRDTEAVMGYIDGLPRNERVWQMWAEKADRIKTMDYKKEDFE